MKWNDGNVIVINVTEIYIQYISKTTPLNGQELTYKLENYYRAISLC